MNILSWILIIIGTLVFACLFDMLFKFIFYLFSNKSTTDMAEASSIKWWEHSTLLRQCHHFFHNASIDNNFPKHKNVLCTVHQKKISDITLELHQNFKLRTVGQLLKALKPYTENYGIYDIMFLGDNNLPCYPTSAELDINGRLCLRLRDDDGINYSVSSLFYELKKFDINTEVYVAGRGCFLNIKNNDKEIFYEDNDTFSDNDVIACKTTKIGIYTDTE